MKKISRRKHVTLLLVPDDSSKVFSVKMRSGFFIALAVLWITGIAFSVYIVSQHVNYKLTAQQNRYLTAKTRQFATEMVQARETVKRVSEVEKQMRSMLQLKSKKAIIKYTGFGGPSLVDSDLIEKNLKSGEEAISAKAFEAAVKYVNEESERNEQSFQEMVEYITEQRAKLTAVPAGWPVKGWITGAFGSRLDPFTGALSFHEGVDIANDEGTPIKAAADGVVMYSAWERGYGNLVTVNHGNGYTTRYGHMQRSVVSPGQHLKKGQTIGNVGNTGRSTNPHLHYEVRLNGVSVNAVKYINKEVALK